MDDDFKWNFLSEIKQPQLEIEGPSVGSLLYALNPQTSELGLKQMESELNQQLKANEMFDKRGEEALKFMENRVQEDIENKKLQNVDAGHFNSLMGNLTQAYATNSPSLPVILDQVKRTIPNAETFIAEAQKNAETAKAQTSLFNKYDSDLPRGSMWESNGQRKAWITTMEGDKGLSEDLKSKLSYIKTEVSWEEKGFYYDDAQPGKHPYHEAGLYYIQELHTVELIREDVKLDIVIQNIDPGLTPAFEIANDNCKIKLSNRNKYQDKFFL